MPCLGEHGSCDEHGSRGFDDNLVTAMLLLTQTAGGIKCKTLFAIRVPLVVC